MDKHILSCCAVLVAVAAAAHAGEPINVLCPVMTAEKVDPTITVEYEGKTIGFCCGRCVKKFKADPERYLANIPEMASATPSALPNAAPPPAPEPMPFAGRVHPILVHFPIAGLPLALLAWIVGATTRNAAFAKADVVPLLVSTLFAVPAFFTGRIAEHASQFSGEMHEIAERHEQISTAVMIACLALTVLRLSRWQMRGRGWRALYTVGLLAANGLVVYTGYLGGSLVFGPDHLAF